MLTLLIGKAGTGKTSAVMEEIKTAVFRRQANRIMIVPEQYSHEAERELCRRCGDTMSLYAEVFSFTGLARRMTSKLGGAAGAYLDKGGRLLCMALALKEIAPRLRVFASAERRAELQSLLLAAVDELKSSCVSSEMLLRVSAELNDGLGDKLNDLALILDSYNAVVAAGHADPTDRLSLLASQIPESGIDSETHIYIDGFTDFTRQEQELINALLGAGAELSVCLTLDDLYGENEIFELSRRAARQLIHSAEEQGVGWEIKNIGSESEKSSALRYFAENMFSGRVCGDAPETDEIELWRAGTMADECEFAAAKAIELVRERGCRWRDIAVAVRGFEDYRGMLESVFRHYGVPLFTARRSDLISKPLPAMISAAYEIILGGWDVDDVTSYMRTGLTGLTSEQCDTLAGYIYKWQLRGSAWQRGDDWRQHPDGYGKEYDSKTNERLAEINTLRRSLAEPLIHFAAASQAAETASAQASALAGLLTELRLSERLSERARELYENGRETLAAEYEQLWALTVNALEQCDAILGSADMDAQEFGRLFTLMLSKYDVGLIPVSLDRVSAGDFDRNRRRHIKHLIVLGASDQRLPQLSEGASVFSDDERERLLEQSIELGGGEGELWREFSLIYNCLTMAGESLVLCCPTVNAEGEAQRPAFVYKRAQALFGLEEKTVELSDARMSAPSPAMSLAANALAAPGGRTLAAAEYLRAHEPARYAALERAAAMTRGTLSPRSVEALYGRRLKLSASRIDKFASCRFAYFCQYGLKAKPSRPAGFQPPDIGVFMHEILEGVAREVGRRGGWSAIGDEELKALTDKYVQEYISRELDDFREKSSRFVYLFKRLCQDMRQIVLDMAQELRRSSFVPLDFELDFSAAGDIMPSLLDGGELVLTGIADRVDGWVHDGRLYIRVVDYKTGSKSFSLSDIWYGMGLQMLLYLFALEENGSTRYGREIVPAGVMYVPAKNASLSRSERIEKDEAEMERLKALRRSGIVLDDEAVINAWEHGEEKLFIPIRTSRGGKPAPETLASTERLGVLRRHVEKRLTEMAAELRAGSITADPYYKAQQKLACLNCDFFDACHFADGQNGEHCRIMPTISAEKVWSMMEGGETNE